MSNITNEQIEESIRQKIETAINIAVQAHKDELEKGEYDMVISSLKSEGWNIHLSPQEKEWLETDGEFKKFIK